MLHSHTFLVAKDLRIDLKSFKMSANGDLWNMPTHQIEWKIHSTNCLRNWNQNMGLPLRLLPALYKKNLVRLKSSTEDSETSQQPRTSVSSSTGFEKTILKLDCIFCSKEGRKKITERSVWTTEATTAFECQCLKLQKIKRKRSSCGGSEVLISLDVKQVFTAAVAGSIRVAQLTGGVQMKKTREGMRTLKSHIGQPLRKFVK